jgi:DNA-binding transcriptional LysR family regulator
MEIRELRSFCSAARFKSISRAAEQLGMGQPTVTTHIKKLEAELNTVLFDRVKRPIQLTLAGKRLQELAVPLVEGLDTLVQSAAEAEERGPVVLAATPDLIPHTLLSVVRVFTTLHPHIHLTIKSARRTQIMHMIADGDADIGIIQHYDRDESFQFEGLFVYERVLITPSSHPLAKEPVESIEQIAQYPLIMMSEGTHTRDLLESEFKRRGISYEIVVDLDSMDMIKRYVALGLGISVGPRLAIDPEDHVNLGVVSLAHILPVEQGGIVTLKGKQISKPAERFISVMKDTLAAATG